MRDYANVPRLIAAVLSIRAASLAELDTVLSIEDCYDLIEVAAIDAHNHRVLNRQPPRA